MYGSIRGCLMTKIHFSSKTSLIQHNCLIVLVYVVTFWEITRYLERCFRKQKHECVCFVVMLRRCGNEKATLFIMLKQLVTPAKSKEE